MSRSLLDQLGEQRVPQRPPEFRRHLHERLNVRLTLALLVEFAVQVLPYAFLPFFQSLCGAVIYSFTGRYPQKGDLHAKRNDQDG
jgi:hypothetical protein